MTVGSNRFQNTTGGRLVSIAVESGAQVHEASSVHTGQHTRYKAGFGSVAYSSLDGIGVAEYTPYLRSGFIALTPATEETVLSITLSQFVMKESPQGLAVGLALNITNTLGDLNIRYKIGSTTVQTVNYAAHANTREFIIDWEVLRREGSTTAAETYLTGAVRDVTTLTVTPIADLGGVTFDTTSGTVTFSVTVELVNAGDSGNLRKVKYGKIGW